MDRGAWQAVAHEVTKVGHNGAHTHTVVLQGATLGENKQRTHSTSL